MAEVEEKAANLIEETAEAVVEETIEEAVEGADEKASFDERYQRQKKRAIGAVIIMAIISVVIVGAAELAYYSTGYFQEMISNSFTDRTAATISSRVNGLTDDAPIDPFYVLLIGSDTRKGTAIYTGKEEDHSQKDQHADVLTLMRVDPQNYLVTLVSIPRDTQLKGSDGKINETLLTGDPQLVVDAAESLTGVNIDYYMLTTFIGFEDLVDSLEGVKAVVPADMSLKDPVSAQKVSLEKSKRKTNLDGKEALVLARVRKVFEDKQDAYRQLSVRNLETAIIKKSVATFKVEDVGLLLSILEDNTKTNMEHDFTARVLRNFLENGKLISFYSASGPYDGDLNKDGQWVVPQDEEQWAALMAAVDSGRDPSNVIEQVSFHDLD